MEIESTSMQTHKFKVSTNLIATHKDFFSIALDCEMVGSGHDGTLDLCV